MIRLQNINEKQDDIGLRPIVMETQNLNIHNYKYKMLERPNT